jgi:hypothetical protein
MIFFRTDKTVISPFLEGIARIFHLAGSIEKPQILTFRSNLRLFYYCGEAGILRYFGKAANLS